MHRALRIVLLALPLFGLVLLGFRPLDVFSDMILSGYNLRWRIAFSGQTSIDFYGAIVPVAAAFLAAAFLLRFRKFHLPAYLLYFFLPVLFCFAFSYATPVAVVFNYTIPVFLISLLALVISTTDGHTAGLYRPDRPIALVFAGRTYVNALLIGYSYVTLSCLIVDLSYSLFHPSAYIGGAGLVDGLVVSGLATLFTVTIFMVFARLFVEIRNWYSN